MGPGADYPLPPSINRAAGALSGSAANRACHAFYTSAITPAALNECRTSVSVRDTRLR
jgi:hypothetical protein